MFCDYLIFWLSHARVPKLAGNQILESGKVFEKKPKCFNFKRRRARKANK